MHEYSITCSILDILNKVVKENKIKKIKKINFEISSIAYIEPDSVEFYYNFLTEDNNVLRNAKLKFKKKKTQIKCGDCKEISNIENLFVAECPKCSGRNIKFIDDDEIKIISVET
ncbi:MAG: hydrogenase maturation nickel metallochaperone HypA [Actinobacteria bacterium]|nr:hydrogenase maturation nickel metallochaperone HypA [Actinomycetota bacterium]MBU4482895.1 hydrogenase maturation nickel metallochaperone HypA [Actinomycetota bacterium]